MRYLQQPPGHQPGVTVWSPSGDSPDPVPCPPPGPRAPELAVDVVSTAHMCPPDPQNDAVPGRYRRTRLCRVVPHSTENGVPHRPSSSRVPEFVVAAGGVSTPATFTSFSSTLDRAGEPGVGPIVHAPRFRRVRTREVNCACPANSPRPKPKH